MSIYNLERLFNPSSVAVIGASGASGRIGNALMKNLVEGGFQGRIVPVNPKYGQIMGYPCLDKVADIDEPVDLAVIAVPIGQTPDVVAQCVASGVRSAIIISAGGKEIGSAGADIENRIARIAAAGGMRIIGPNCLGVMAPHHNLNASFAAGMPKPGKMAFVSQSGAVCTAILDLSFKESIHFSHFVSIGSMADVDFGDMIDYLGRDRAVTSILLYVEQLTNVRKFMSATRAISRAKPIIVLKAGSSKAGAMAAASHTGALAGEDAIYDAAFRQAGVIRVHTIEELFDCAELMAKNPKPLGPGVAVVTNGGGPGVMAADAIAQHGLQLAELSDSTIEACGKILPPHWSGRNPVDILGDASAQTYKQVVETVLRDRNVHGLVVMLTPQAVTEAMAVANNLIAMVKGRSLPIFAVWMGGRDVQPAVQALNDAGIATYGTPERAVIAFSYMVQHSSNAAMLREIPPRFSLHVACDGAAARRVVDGAMTRKEQFIDESAAREILQAYGIAFSPAYLAASPEAAVAMARDIGFPVAVKIASPDISHKTDVRGVHLNLRNEADVRRAFAAIMDSAGQLAPQARLSGVTVQRFIESPDVELLLGAKRDELFGPVVVFGMGGIFTELIGDRSLALPPLNRQLIRRLIDGTKVAQLLKGYRKITPVHMESLEMMIQCLSQLLIDVPEIAELDINPVVVKDGQPLALDARIRLQPSPRPAPMHLVISPYPAQFERERLTRSGMHLNIRPIKPEDADLFVELFHTLSPTSVYFRFFSYINDLTPEMLAVLTQVDYDRHIALVAIDRSSTAEKMLGVARFIADPDLSNVEFSILVGDQWQGQGVGAQLLLSLLEVARQQGVKKMWGTVLRENHQMLGLGKRLGFQVKYDAEEGENRLTIDLSQVEFE